MREKDASQGCGPRIWRESDVHKDSVQGRSSGLKGLQSPRLPQSGTPGDLARSVSRRRLLSVMPLSCCCAYHLELSFFVPLVNSYSSIRGPAQIPLLCQTSTDTLQPHRCTPMHTAPGQAPLPNLFMLLGICPSTHVPLPSNWIFP